MNETNGNDRERRERRERAGLPAEARSAKAGTNGNERERFENGCRRRFAAAPGGCYNSVFLATPDGLIWACDVRKWRNWQTRKPQELVPAREWRFESSLPHQLIMGPRNRAFPL